MRLLACNTKGTIVLVPVSKHEHEFESINGIVFIHGKQGSTAPSDPSGAEPSAPAGQKTAGSSPLHFMRLPVHVLHRTKAGGETPQHQDPDRGLPPDS